MGKIRGNMKIIDAVILFLRDIPQKQAGLQEIGLGVNKILHRNVKDYSLRSVIYRHMKHPYKKAEYTIERVKAGTYLLSKIIKH